MPVLLIPFRLCVRFRQAQYEFSVERQRLQDDIEAVTVLVHERGADRDPEVVLMGAISTLSAATMQLLRAVIGSMVNFVMMRT